MFNDDFDIGPEDNEESIGKEFKSGSFQVLKEV
jgi:hypothetical protein